MLSLLSFLVIFAHSEMKKKLAKLEQINANKPAISPAVKNSKSQPKPKGGLAGKISRTCRNWNLGLW